MSKTNILIIEDDAFQRNLLVRMAASMTQGKIHIATNGQEALASLDMHDTPELILCDLQMPEMDGVEFLRKLAEREVQSTIALISAAAPDVVESVKQMAISYGLQKVDSVGKPVNRQKLEQLIHSVNAPEQGTASNRRRYQPSDAEILQAMEQRELRPFFQPHIDAKTQKVTGAEALVRWVHPEQGILGPDVFLNRLFQLDLTHALTLSVLDASVEACARWHRQDLKYHVAVNVAPSDLAELSFVDEVLQVLSRHGLPAQYLTLEVTETEITPHLAKSLDTMSRLRINNVGVSIDDFGTGHSSMSQLITSPFTELKVDMFFVRNMHDSDKHKAAVYSSLSLAHHLGLKSVAEGVETIEHARELKEMGCDILQGFCYSPALPEAKFVQWCSQHVAKPLA